MNRHHPHFLIHRSIRPAIQMTPSLTAPFCLSGFAPLKRPPTGTEVRRLFSVRN